MNKEISIRGLAEFLNKYKKSNIIYPDAVKRYLNITLKETYEHLDNRVIINKDIKRIYIPRCPHCYHSLSDKYDTMNEVLTKDYIYCSNCDDEFKPDINNISVCYEKL